MMKRKFQSAAVLFFLPLWLCAQQTAKEVLSIPLTRPGQPGKLQLEQLAGSIRVSSYEGQEVKVTVTYARDANDRSVPETKNGMKRINAASVNIAAEENDNTVRIVNKRMNRAADFDIQVPRQFSLTLRTVNDGVIEVTGVTGAFELSNTNGPITLESVGGSVSADSVNGDVKVTFTGVEVGAPMAFSSLNGDLDVQFPASLRANVMARTDQGDIYTDFDLKMGDSEMDSPQRSASGIYKVKTDPWVRGTIGGGGPEMMFKTYNGDISIRKG